MEREQDTHGEEAVPVDELGDGAVNADVWPRPGPTSGRCMPSPRRIAYRLVAIVWEFFERGKRTLEWDRQRFIRRGL